MKRIVNSGPQILPFQIYKTNQHQHVDEIQLTSLDTFVKAEEIARRHKLDLLDSLQLVSVKHGKFSSGFQESKTVLITADRALASAAKTEGLRVWNCEEEATPPAQ